MQDILIYTMLVAFGFLTSFIGTNVGGTGLLIVPVLIFLGLPPHLAIGTRRLMGMGAVPSSIIPFYREGKINYKIGIGVSLVAMIGSIVGARTLIEVPEKILERLIGIFIIVVLIFILFQKNFGIETKGTPSLLKKGAGYILFFVVGFTASFFGGGGQVFGTPFLIYFFHMTFLEAAGTRKISGLLITLSGLTVYFLEGLIYWPYAIPLLIGGTLGGYAGSKYGLKKGDAWVRKLFLAMVFFLALTLIF